MAYGSPSPRSLRDILYRVAAEFNGDHNDLLLRAVGGDPSHTTQDRMSILTVLRIVEEAVLGELRTFESTPVLDRVRNLADLFDVDLLHYPRPPPDIFDRLVAEAEAEAEAEAKGVEDVESICSNCVTWGMCTNCREKNLKSLLQKHYGPEYPFNPSISLPSEDKIE